MVGSLQRETVIKKKRVLSSVGMRCVKQSRCGLVLENVMLNKSSSMKLIVESNEHRLSVALSEESIEWSPLFKRSREKLVDIIGDDCVMEGVGPAPDGNRIRAVRIRALL